ncbi:ABC transporter substrate-binding protein [Embleya sp. AB8]|uniref:ABC transporter substrate-binding protein n=1 Tax=Embleya sp. AB8 TaxID=3156304 RepID=UPI003C735D97
MRRAPRGAAAAAVASVLLATGCGGTGSGGSAGGGDTVTVGILGDPGTMNPLTTLVSTAVSMNRFAYDSLVNVMPDGRIVSGVAEKWTSDSTSATFTLKRGVTCGNGAPLTASNIAAQYNYIADPATQSPVNGLFVPTGVSATGDDEAGTLTLKTAEPTPFLVRGTAFLRLVCPTGMQAQDTLAHGSDGTGPYRLTEVVPGDHFTFTKRAGYTWGPEGRDNSATPDRVIFKVVANESTRANLVLGGQLNVAPIGGADRSRLAAAGVKGPTMRDPWGMLIFNEAPNRVTADPQVRKALIAALDLKQIGAVATGGKGLAPTRFGIPMAPPCVTDSVTGNVPAHDPAQAAELLKAAGWKKSGGRWSKDGKRLSISMPYPGANGSQLVSAAELAVKQWESFGVDVSTRPTNPSTNASTLMGGQWEVAWGPLSVATPDQLIPFFSGTHPPKGLNFGSLDNPEYQRLAALAMAKPDITGCPEWSAAESELLKRVDVVTFVDALTPWFTRGASFELDNGGIVPITLRKGGAR